MKIIKNKRRKAKALMIINIRKEYRKLYLQRLEEKEMKFSQEKDEMNHFFEKNLRKQNESIEKKYRTLLNEKDLKIQELENKINENKAIFTYIKEREQDLENVMAIVGNKMKGFAELVANGYSTVQNSFSQIEGYGGYNRKHLKHDAKIINALKE